MVLFFRINLINLCNLCPDMQILVGVNVNQT